MRIHLLTISDRQPGWVQDAYGEFAKRLGKDCQLELREIAPAKRGKSGSAERWREDEWSRAAAAIPKGASLIVLDEHGECISTVQLAQTLDRWQHGGSDICLLVGGADGLHTDALRAARWRWSLSPLTLPHGLVRVIVVEQIYRAWTILNNHPYHRA